MQRAAPQLFHLSGTHLCGSATRSIHLSMVALAGKKSVDLSAKDRVLYIDEQNNKSEMSVEKLLHLADGTEGRSIYKVGIVGLAAELPAFKLMNAREVEIAVSKARHHSTGQTFQRLDPLNMRIESRVKEKKYNFKSTSDKNQASIEIMGRNFERRHLYLNSLISPQVLASIKKIVKELEKGNIVRVTVESKGDPSATKDIENIINDGLKQVLDSSEVIKSSFFLDIHEGKSGKKH